MKKLINVIRSYVSRRISIPVNRNDLVLDIGGGDQPHWRADVIVDLYPGEEYSAQRFLGGSAVTNRPVFAVDAAKTPFRDDAFDFVVCSHTLEHVADPAAVVAEMMRLAPRGYLEVPSAGMAKILDFPTHLWWCSLEGETLVFQAKDRQAFDQDIDSFLGVPSVRSAFNRIAFTNFDHCIITLTWSRPVRVRVEGDPNLDLAESHQQHVHATGFATRLARRAQSIIASTAWRRRRSRRPLVVGDLTEDSGFGDPKQRLQPGILRSNYATDK